MLRGYGGAISGDDSPVFCDSGAERVPFTQSSPLGLTQNKKWREGKKKRWRKIGLWGSAVGGGVGIWVMGEKNGGNGGEALKAREKGRERRDERRERRKDGGVKK